VSDLEQWTDVREILPWLPPAEPYFVAGVRRRELAETLARAGFAVSVLDGERITSAQDLLVDLGKVLRFREGYGANWEALGDCLAEMARPGATKQALVWNASDTLLRQDLHAFVQAVAQLCRYAEGMSSMHMEHPLQMEVFFLGDWEAVSDRLAGGNP
jgi:RNAse (barnase) inhibitor barstar